MKKNELLNEIVARTDVAKSGKNYIGENKGSKWKKTEHDDICFKMSKSKKELA